MTFQYVRFFVTYSGQKDIIEDVSNVLIRYHSSPEPSETIPKV